MTNHMKKLSKHAVKRLYFVDMMKICLHTPFMVNITSDLCAPLRGSALYISAAAHSLGKSLRCESDWKFGKAGLNSKLCLQFKMLSFFVVSSVEAWKL